MHLPTPTTTAEIYLAAILKELQAQRPADPSTFAKLIGEQIELKEPKRKSK